MSATCGCPILTGIVVHEATCWLSPQGPTINVPHKCPSCDGCGKVSRPPWVAGDQPEWSSSGTALYDCRACRGTGIVWSKA